MTTYLLDTDTFIYLLKHEAERDAKATDIGLSLLALSTITVAETLHGAYYSAKPAQSLTMTRELLKQFTIIDLTTSIADMFGQMKADLRRQGESIADFDLLIGATTVVTGRTLVTNNMKHFRRLGSFGLVVDNWKTPPRE